MNRRRFVASLGLLAGAYCLPTWTRALPGGTGTRLIPVNVDALMGNLLLRKTGSKWYGEEIFAWLTPVQVYRLKAGAIPPWFHRDGPFGLYQTFAESDAQSPERVAELHGMLRGYLEDLAERYMEEVVA